MEYSNCIRGLLRTVSRWLPIGAGIVTPVHSLQPRSPRLFHVNRFYKHVRRGRDCSCYSWCWRRCPLDDCDLSVGYVVYFGTNDKKVKTGQENRFKTGWNQRMALPSCPETSENCPLWKQPLLRSTVKRSILGFYSGLEGAACSITSPILSIIASTNSHFNVFL